MQTTSEIVPDASAGAAASAAAFVLPLVHSGFSSGKQQEQHLQ